MNIGVIGQNGEDRVALFLRKQGFDILKRNFVCRFGEIDIIARNDEYIIFVEVKTRKSDSIADPKDSVDVYKQQRILGAAKNYIYRSRCLLQPRFDVAEVTVSETDGRLSYSLNYIKNAF